MGSAVSITISEENLRAKRIREAVSTAQTKYRIAVKTRDSEELAEAWAAIGELEETVDRYKKLMIKQIGVGNEQPRSTQTNP